MAEIAAPLQEQGHANSVVSSQPALASADSDTVITSDTVQPIPALDQHDGTSESLIEEAKAEEDAEEDVAEGGEEDEDEDEDEGSSELDEDRDIRVSLDSLTSRSS